LDLLIACAINLLDKTPIGTGCGNMRYNAVRHFSRAIHTCALCSKRVRLAAIAMLTIKKVRQLRFIAS
jgi:hypothetical protein